MIKREKTVRNSYIIMLLIAAAGGAFVWWYQGAAYKQAGTEPEPVIEKPRVLRIEGKYLFSGTVVWARNYERWSLRADGSTDYAYPFSGLGTFERQKYDAWLADLECASGQEVIPFERADQDLIFNCRPEFLPEAAKFFSIFNLANNHTDNLGAEGFVETRQNLEANKIQHIGHYDPSVTQDICEMIALPVRVISEYKGAERSRPAKLPVAMCAWHYFYRLPQPGEIEVAKEFAGTVPTMGFVQAGVEYQAKADAVQESIARRIADQGTMFVVGNSAHWVQNGEVYNGVPILYSTGNFIFDQQSDREVTRSVSLELTMQAEYDENLEALLKIGENCVIYKDQCFAQIVEQKLTKPILKSSYGIVAGDGSGRLQKRAGPELQAAVESRVGWEAMKAALTQQ